MGLEAKSLVRSLSLKIAFVDYMVNPSKPGRSGLSDIVWDMATELVALGHEVHVVASYATSEVPDGRVVLHNFETPPIGYRNVIGHVWIIKRASDIIKKINPDVVHVPEYLSSAVMASLGVEAPMILTVPGNIYQRLSVQRGSSYEWYYAQILKWAAKVSARRCNAVIAISKEMKMWWERTGSTSERTPVIPLGASPLRFHYLASARAELGIDDRFFLLYVGRFAKEKGLRDLLESLRRLPEDLRTSVQATLIGAGPERQELENLIDQWALESVIKVISWVPQENLLLWYSAADALVLPSYSEGFSRTIVEAMMCGTPIIGTKISGTEDHVLDSLTGRLFSPGGVAELSAILTEIVSDPAIVRSMRAKVYSYAQENFLWSGIVEQIVEQVYRPAVMND